MSDNKNTPDGFEEFANALNELSPSQKEELKKNSDTFQSFELYSFLEEEVNRLEKMSKVFGDTAHQLKHFSQENHILDLKRSENKETKDHFINILSDQRNNLWRSISETFNDSF
jgi:hypothetical protein